jgi:lantibiotic leader peptide-processing serine protease
MNGPGARPALRRAVLFLTTAALAAGLLGPPAVTASEQATQRYIVVFSGSYALDGSYALGGDYALNHGYALQIVNAAGGTVVSDLSRQLGVMVVDSASAQFYALMTGYALVDAVGEDWSFQGIPSAAEMAAAPRANAPAGGGPESTNDPLEPEQWDMAMIRTGGAHAVEAGWRKVDVGVLDSGVDGLHLDFDDDGIPGGSTNVDCARGRDFTTDNPPASPSLAAPTGPCVDNNFHGTHVAGTIAAQANGVGIVGVAPNVTIVPVKVCDADGHCYASDVVDGLTYAADAKLDVINMSFFVDDEAFQESTELKCGSDPAQAAFREAVNRAMRYAIKQGVAPVAALGNSDQDLAHPVDANGQPIDPECDVVPAETPGVTGTVALGAQSEKSSYSSYGAGAADVAAPGGNGLTGDCSQRDMILSTFPGNSYACISGTSMASPHAAGVAALIASRFGALGGDGDVRIAPSKVADLLAATAIDIGLAGYDECFGNGRVDALRAVTRNTSAAYDASAPFCPEYDD